MEQLSDATLIIDDDIVGVVPNTIKFKYGFPETKIRTMSVGGGKTEQVYSNDVETSVGEVSADIMTSIEYIRQVRRWKARRNKMVVQVIGQDSEGNVLTLTWTQSALVNDPEMEVASEGKVPLMLKGNTAI